MLRAPLFLTFLSFTQVQTAINWDGEIFRHEFTAVGTKELLPPQRFSGFLAILFLKIRV
ncbi:MAG: hypothetical protein WCA35_04200 [Kovacikia sp.]